MKIHHESAWQNALRPRFRTLEAPASFDVVVVGGGITGLTAAYLLKRAGKTVCVLERDRWGNGDTGATTAHLTYVTDARLTELVGTFGEDAARLAWQAGAAAINTIEQIAEEEKIDCQFRRVPGFLHAALHGKADETEALQQDARLAAKLGFAAAYMANAPYVNRPALRFANQAKFHPLQYLAGLARSVDGDDSAVFENSEAGEIDADRLTVTVNGHRIRCGHLILATHVPLMGVSGLLGATLFQTKLAPYTSYALGAHVPAGLILEASFWDTSDPYYYLRVDAGDESDYIIFGGEDHKTGQEPDTEAAFARLQARLLEIVPSAKVDRRWSGQVVETHDGLPYIGATAKNQFIATGFAGNGMTFGTLGGMMACDFVQGRESPWSDLFDPGRRKLRAGWDYLKENLDYPYYLLRTQLKGAEAASPDEVAPGEGRILKVDGQRVACSRDNQGKLSMVSATCTHMGCLVGWNRAEQTWDCACHGSRFKPTGEVLAGPAETALEPMNELFTAASDRS